MFLLTEAAADGIMQRNRKVGYELNVRIYDLYASIYTTAGRYGLWEWSWILLDEEVWNIRIFIIFATCLYFVSLARLHHPWNRQNCVSPSRYGHWNEAVRQETAPRGASGWQTVYVDCHSCPVAEAWVETVYFQGQKKLWDCSLMAAQSQEVSVQLIDWPSQIRAELHEPINGSDTSGPAGNLRSNYIACFHPSLYICPCLYPFFASPPSVSLRYIKGPEILVTDRRCYHMTFKGTECIWEGEMRRGAHFLKGD